MSSAGEILPGMLRMKRDLTLCMCGTLEIAHLSSDSFSVEKIAEIDPNLPAANIIVCIAASIKTNQFKALMKIESNCIRIAGLSF